MSEGPFFIGYLPAPAALRRFLFIAAAGVFGVLAGAGWVLGTGQDDPGTAAIRGDFGRQTVTGVVELVPYPLLHVTKGTERVPAGRTLMLTGAGKSGPGGREDGLHGKMAQASGVILQRGALEMLQLRGGRRGLGASDAETAPLPKAEDLGRWRLTGEICDGKCLSGAMRPGRGLAHKACANLCLLGEVPPVFVSTAPVEHSEFLLVTGPDATPLPPEAYDFVAQYVRVEGQITRRGDLLVFALDPATLELAQ